MILGIDATNIRDGGGLVHLREILGKISDEEMLFFRGNYLVEPHDLGSHA